MIDIGGDSTMGRWNPELLDTHIAPGISEFREALIPDLSGRFPQADFWVGNYFLNSVLRVGFRDRWRQIVNGFLRRASQGFAAYLDARRLTLEYLDGNSPLNPRIGRYYKATAAWEGFAIDMTIATDLFKWMNNGAGAFTKNDGSKEYRL